MNTRVKICGVTRPEDARLAASLGAWAVGMILAPGWPRTVDVEQASRIVQAVPPGVLKVGVFVDPSEKDVRRFDDALGLDLIQLHGAEGEGFCRLLGAERIVEAVRLQTPAHVEDAAQRAAAYILADRPRNQDGSRGPIDWKLAASLAKRSGRMLLAGTLTPKNVGQAVAQVRPFAVDVSSGVEKSPGVKDEAALADFFKAVEETRA